MPPRMILSTSARRATMAITLLYGWSGSAKKGIFCPDTSVLFKSIPAIPVGMSCEGCFLLYGLTEGPPISRSSPSISGPPSIGRPYALKNRPASWSLTLSTGGSPRKDISASVGMPSVPENTCRVTMSPFVFTTCASLPSTTASSSLATPAAFRDTVAFVMASSCVYVF